MNKSKIEWCDMTWNPVTGCLHGCDYCYARKIANRFGGSSLKALKSHIAKNKLMVKHGIDMGDTELPKIFELDKKIFNITGIDDGFIDPYPYGFEPTFHKYRLIEPSKKIKGSKIFVCSMADLFGEWVPDEWIEKVFEACETAPQHKYLFLTKNPARYRYFRKPQNCWIGTSITNQNLANKNLKEMVNTLGKKFVSIEPLLGPINLRNIDAKEAIYNSLTGTIHTLIGYSENRAKISWVIVGAQTGSGAVKPKPEWVQSIIDQCRSAGVPIFLKDNLNWPEKIQEFPEGLK